MDNEKKYKISIAIIPGRGLEISQKARGGKESCNLLGFAKHIKGYFPFLDLKKYINHDVWFTDTP